MHRVKLFNLPFKSAQREPPATALTTFPQSFSGRCRGTFTCVSFVTSPSWLYSELPQPKRSPFSNKRRSQPTHPQNQSLLYSQRQTKMIGWLVGDWLVGWFSDWLVGLSGWLVCCLVDWFAVRLVYCLDGWFVVRFVYCLVGWFVVWLVGLLSGLLFSVW